MWVGRNRGLDVLNRVFRKCLLEKLYMSKDMKEVRGGATWMTVPGRGRSRCKGPEAETCLAV